EHAGVAVRLNGKLKATTSSPTFTGRSPGEGMIPSMLIPALPPQAVPVYSGFDYVTVDPQRRRVYAAHTGSRALLIVDADSGKVLGQVRVGPLHGVAVDPADG